LRLQEEISAQLGAQVTIKPGKKSTGNVHIHYSNLEQLDEILIKLRK
jgi:ParB family chromosome partitioning protein